MPELFRYKGYKFFFYSNEGDPPEPLHVHVRKGEENAKLWMDPQVRIAYSYKIDRSMLRELIVVAQENRELIERRWHEHVGDS
jgi:hypothetical protein